MRIRLTQIDGKLPSLALMKLALYHRAHGDEVRFTRHAERRRGEQICDRTLPLGHAPASLERRTLAQFRRWAIRRYYTVVDFADYDTSVHAQRTEPRRRCRHCSRSLPAGARSDARFCSESCRSTHFRHQAVYNAVTNARSAASPFRARPAPTLATASVPVRSLPTVSESGAMKAFKTWKKKKRDELYLRKVIHPAHDNLYEAL